ncbi:MAG: hypothetical protein ABSG33_11675 [Candidatus Bathyarchaeia archaeon]
MLSDARLREAVSWGKISEKVRHILIEDDVTTITLINDHRASR